MTTLRSMLQEALSNYIENGAPAEAPRCPIIHQSDFQCDDTQSTRTSLMMCFQESSAIVLHKSLRMVVHGPWSTWDP